MENLQAFLDDLASEQAVPGGGSVAAFEVSMGAALLAMVARLTLKSKRCVDAWEQAQAVLEKANVLRERASQLIHEDAAAYRHVANTLTLPRGTEGEKAERRAQMQEALKGAAVPPLETMAVARDVIVLADHLVEFGNRSAVSDVGSAVVSAVAGYDAARLNVDINLSAVHDDDWLRMTRLRLDALALPTATVDAVMERVRSIIGGRDG